MRIAEVHNHIRVRAEADVASHLFALILRQRPAQLGGQLGDLARQGSADIRTHPGLPEYAPRIIAEMLRRSLETTG